jgi:hypothetical protein
MTAATSSPDGMSARFRWNVSRSHRFKRLRSTPAGAACRRITQPKRLVDRPLGRTVKWNQSLRSDTPLLKISRSTSPFTESGDGALFAVGVSVHVDPLGLTSVDEIHGDASALKSRWVGGSSS